MAVPKTPFDVMRSARKDRVGEPLTAIESIALQAIKQIIAEGRVATRAEICAAIGSDNYDGGTVAGVIQRLVDKGRITQLKHQRGMQICINGQCTAEPKDQTPHWRDIPRPPSIAIQTLAERDQPCAMTVQQLAREHERNLTDLIVELIQRGLADYIWERA